MGRGQREKERDRFYLAWSPTDALETAVLIAIRSVYIHQYDPRYFLAPHVPSSLATDRTYVYRTSYWSNTSDRSFLNLASDVIWRILDKVVFWIKPPEEYTDKVQEV